MQSDSLPRVEQLHQELAEPGRDILFEAQLAQAGLLYILEEFKTLPAVVNPNPFDAESHPHEHERWWHDHPEEAFAYCRSIEERRLALHQMCVGSLLGLRRTDATI
jgi:hypothetical protein